MSKPIARLEVHDRPSLIWAVATCAKNGDERAKEFIYRKMYGYVTAVVRRYIKSTYDIEELVNETFIKAFKAVHTFTYRDEEEEKAEKLFFGWVGRIAANLSIDHLRVQKRIRMEDDWSEEEIKLIPVSPSDGLEVKDILKLLDKLPDIQRVIFNLYEVEGFSHEEIARQLKIPESTSRTYLTRGKQRLRTLYKQSIAR